MSWEIRILFHLYTSYVCQFFYHFVLICHFTSISSHIISIRSQLNSISSSQKHWEDDYCFRGSGFHNPNYLELKNILFQFAPMIENILIGKFNFLKFLSIESSLGIWKWLAFWYFQNKPKFNIILYYLIVLYFWVQGPKFKKLFKCLAGT